MNAHTKMIAGLAGAAAGALLTMPVYAAGLKTLDDSSLAGITGKSNSVNFSGAGGTLSVTNSTSNGDIGIGFYQWSDDHTGDNSNHKGANDQGGATSHVQQNVAGNVNILLWGAGAQVNTTNATLTAASIDSESWGTMYLGGF